jgi:hypothetical protein
MVGETKPAVAAYRKHVDSVSIDEWERMLRQVIAHTGKSEREVLGAIGLTHSAIHGMRAKKKARRANYLALKTLLGNGEMDVKHPPLTFDETTAVIRGLRTVHPQSAALKSAQSKLALFLALSAE